MPRIHPGNALSTKDSPPHLERMHAVNAILLANMPRDDFLENQSACVFEVLRFERCWSLTTVSAVSFESFNRVHVAASQFPCVRIAKRGLKNRFNLLALFKRSCRWNHFVSRNNQWYFSVLASSMSQYLEAFVDMAASVGGDRVVPSGVTISGQSSAKSSIVNSISKHTRR